MYDFQLIVSSAGRVVQIGRICVSNALKEIGLSSAEADVLMFLYMNGDGIRQDDIVAGVEVSKPAISRTIHSLESKGYVIRKQNTEDKRSYVVSLTDRAREAEGLVKKQYRDLVNAACLGIPEEKVKEVIEVFKDVVNNMEKYRIERFS
ncbi:MAG: MarR family winged helix-turn-helix transcriptional regulator [Bacillota bacterium]|jgi:DNA-binding MarR family transcriptional regulator